MIIGQGKTPHHKRIVDNDRKPRFLKHFPHQRRAKVFFSLLNLTTRKINFVSLVKND